MEGAPLHLFYLLLFPTPPPVRRAYNTHLHLLQHSYTTKYTSNLFEVKYFYISLQLERVTLRAARTVLTLALICRGVVF